MFDFLFLKELFPLNLTWRFLCPKQQILKSPTRVAKDEGSPEETLRMSSKRKRTADKDKVSKILNPFIFSYVTWDFMILYASSFGRLITIQVLYHVPFLFIINL